MGSWERFTEDYALWKSGKRSCSDKGTIWLASKKETIYGGKDDSEEASCLDKSQFFKLLEAFQIPIDYFKPMPESTIHPDDHPGHFIEDLVIGWNIWEDDGGLLLGNILPGDILTLTDRHGLKSVIKITEQIQSDEEKRNRGICADYIGVGTIEGYTSSREREIFLVRVFINHLTLSICIIRGCFFLLRHLLSSDHLSSSLFTY